MVSGVKDVLIQHGLIGDLLWEKKSTAIEMKDWKRLQMQAMGMIYLYLTDDVVIHVLDEIFLMVM